MSAEEKTWKEAVLIVLEESKKPLKSEQIAEKIYEKGLRSERTATPHETVSAAISKSIKNDPTTRFFRVSPGLFTIKGRRYKVPTKPISKTSTRNPEIINSFGMYWEREKIDWSSSTPKLYGIDGDNRRAGKEVVDFYEQVGVYILYDRHRPVYVGKATDKLGVRLREHTIDRLRGRWDRFSWFGVKTVSSSNELKDVKFSQNWNSIIMTLESLIIEAIEPPQNRRRGDHFNAIEYLQVEDPDFETKRQTQIVMNLLSSNG